MTFHRNDACFRCPCLKCTDDPNSIGIDQKLCDKLNTMQSHIIGESMPVQIIVTSGRRCAEHNEKVGGAPGSQHLYGFAVDILTKEMSEFAYRLVDAAMVFNIPFIEVAPHHVHLDMRPILTPKLIVGAG